jgi:ribonuclease HII
MIPTRTAVDDGELLIGVDENGLGARLGPMTVTGVRVRVDRGALPDRRALARWMERVRIGDSKTLCAHGSMGEMERRVLALLEVHCGLSPRDLDGFARDTAVESELALRRDCPSGEAPRVCFETAVSLPAFGEGPSEDDRDRARAMIDEGFRIEAVRVAPVCAGRINLGRARGRSRLDLDLDAMLSVVEALSVNGRTAEVSLGKVGGRTRYQDAVAARFALVRTEREERALSRYEVPSVGTLSFVMDGDGTEPAIALASMFGKYARELWMHRHNRYWTAAVAGTAPASGYHDPVTDRLARATEPLRRALPIEDRCFER